MLVNTSREEGPASPDTEVSSPKTPRSSRGPSPATSRSGSRIRSVRSPTVQGVPSRPPSRPARRPSSRGRSPMSPPSPGQGELSRPPSRPASRPRGRSPVSPLTSPPRVNGVNSGGGGELSLAQCAAVGGSGGRGGGAASKGGAGRVANGTGAVRSQLEVSGKVQGYFASSITRHPNSLFVPSRRAVRDGSERAPQVSERRLAETDPCACV